MAGKRRGHPPDARPSPRSGLLLLLVLRRGGRPARPVGFRRNGGQAAARAAPGTAEVPARHLPAHRGGRRVGEGLEGRGGPPRLGGVASPAVRPGERRNA